MPITIHGKEYVTVAERVKMLHDQKELHGKFSIETEIISHDPVVVKATVTLGEQLFTGISAANPNKTIEKQSPYEVAETSAIGRALGFAGFGLVDSIATADEMIKAELANDEQRPAKSRFQVQRSITEHESGEYCQKCNSADLLVRVSSSGSNPGRSYYYCRGHKGFSHWTENATITTD